MNLSADDTKTLQKVWRALNGAARYIIVSNSEDMLAIANLPDALLVVSIIEEAREALAGIISEGE